MVLGSKRYAVPGGTVARVNVDEICWVMLMTSSMGRTTLVRATGV